MGTALLHKSSDGQAPPFPGHTYPTASVKGRIDGADTVMITRQEVITSLHEPDKFILAVVQVENGFAREPRYVCGALDTREPPFEHNAIQFSIKSLLERAEVPN